MIFLVFIPIASGAAASEQKRYVYDEAGLLDQTGNREAGDAGS